MAAILSRDELSLVSTFSISPHSQPQLTIATRPAVGRPSLNVSPFPASTHRYYKASSWPAQSQFLPIPSLNSPLLQGQQLAGPVSMSPHSQPQLTVATRPAVGRPSLNVSPFPAWTHRCYKASSWPAQSQCLPIPSLNSPLLQGQQLADPVSMSPHSQPELTVATRPAVGWPSLNVSPFPASTHRCYKASSWPAQSQCLPIPSLNSPLLQGQQLAGPVSMSPHSQPQLTVATRPAVGRPSLNVSPFPALTHRCYKASRWPAQSHWQNSLDDIPCISDMTRDWK